MIKNLLNKKQCVYYHQTEQHHLSYLEGSLRKLYTLEHVSWILSLKIPVTQP